MGTDHIQAIAQTARAKYPAGRCVALPNSMTIHETALKRWKGEWVPAPACHVGTFQGIEDSGISVYGPSTCRRTKCREMREARGGLHLPNWPDNVQMELFAA
ncbi:hypothetical protein AB0J38_14280 [Streptomyces sp. NPDC050095]|uniref:hypothetical protein n=1 Tax=unclassified Streptomyces TaxID=2593676 RepID=UPI003443BD65